MRRDSVVGILVILAILVASIAAADNTILGNPRTKPQETRRAQIEKTIARESEALKKAKTAGDRALIERVIRGLAAASAANDLATGSCTEILYDTSREFTEDTHVFCDKIRIKNGVTLRVRNGATLFLLAQQIVIEGKAIIDATGEPGGDGSPAGAHPQPTWNSQGDRDYWRALDDCRKKPNHSDRGQRGRAGENGRPGGIVYLGTRPTGELVPRVAGGAGGRGGAGGAGRLLRNGRNYYCNGCTMNCPGGPSGPDGAPGPSGATIIIEAATK